MIRAFPAGGDARPCRWLDVFFGYPVRANLSRDLPKQMLAGVPPIPWPYRALNLMGSLLGAESWSGLRFDLDRLLEAASKSAGLCNFGDPWFREGLSVFLESLERDAHLSPIGRRGIRGGCGRRKYLV